MANAGVVKTETNDYNFFQKVDVNTSVFGDGYGSSPDLMFNQPITAIIISKGIMLINEGSGVVEFSFDGKIVHGELDSTKASAGLAFDNRLVSMIWLRLKIGSSGPITTSVYVWGTL
jgi:hypothetical protein